MGTNSLDYPTPTGTMNPSCFPIGKHLHLVIHFPSEKLSLSKRRCSHISQMKLSLWYIVWLANNIEKNSAFAHIEQMNNGNQVNQLNNINNKTRHKLRMLNNIRWGNEPDQRVVGFPDMM